MNPNQEISKAQYGPSIMEDSIAQKILQEEKIISQHFSECYKLLPPDKLDLLLKLRPKIQQIIVQYIRGEFPQNGFSEREKELMRKIQGDYMMFLQKQQNDPSIDSPFKIKVDKLNEIVYANLYHKLSFLELEKMENERDGKQAQRIGLKLGMKNLPDINN